MATVAALIAALAIGGGTAIAGGIKAKKARLAAEANAKNRPVYQIPQSEYDTLDLLQNRAGQGLSDSSKQLYQQNQDRALTAGINGVLQGGGSVNNIDSLLSRYSDANGRIALADDEAKVKNIYALIGQRQRMSDFQDKQFQINQQAPFLDKQAAYAQQQAQGQGMVSSGLNTAASGLSTYLGGLGRKQPGVTAGGPQYVSNGGSGGMSGSFGVAAPVPQQTMNSGTAFTNYALGNGYVSNNGGYDLSKLSPEDYQTVTGLLNK